jgi:hypothetical protein
MNAYGAIIIIIIIIIENLPRLGDSIYERSLN